MFEKSALQVLKLTALAMVLATQVHGDSAMLEKPSVMLPPSDALYRDQQQPAIDRVLDLVAHMTLEEKIQYLGGTGFIEGRVIGETQPIARLGLPEFKMTDATLGSKLTKGATLFPSFVALAATFNKSLAYDYGKAVAEQAKADGYRILLGPGVNLYRVPNCGRNFEYLGEDPYLTSRLTVPYINGVQDVGVIATVKHWVANNAEYHRKNSNSVVSERALREIYFPPFEAAIHEAGSKALMTSYNLVNGEWVAESKSLVEDVLRSEWGYDGLIMTDWWATHNPNKYLVSGVDIEMPKSLAAAPENVRDLLEKGVLTEAELDKRVYRILKPCVELGLLDENHADPSLRKKWPAHRRIAEQVSRESQVLLKNNANFLPLDRAGLKSVLLMGPNARETAPSGKGAAGFKPGEEFISYEEAIKEAAGPTVDVLYSEKFDKSLVQNADVVIVFLTMLEHEFMDRNFTFEKEEVDLINQAAEHNPNLMAVVSLGGGVEMQSWIDNVQALIYSWYPGTYGAPGLADLLFGKYSPSGKLPFTIERRPEDAHYFGNYLPEGTILPREFQGWGKNGVPFDITYREGIFTGYRWYDTQGVEPLFPFGFGLSYTDFHYSSLEISTDNLGDGEVARVSFDIKNSGSMAGDEVVQLYVHDVQSSEPRPQKELKGFERLSLKPGETKTVTMVLKKRDISFWHPVQHAWTAEPGNFEILIGSSSRNLPLKGSFEFVASPVPSE